MLEAWKEERRTGRAIIRSVAKGLGSTRAFERACGTTPGFIAGIISTSRESRPSSSIGRTYLRAIRSQTGLPTCALVYLDEPVGRLVREELADLAAAEA